MRGYKKYTADKKKQKKNSCQGTNTRQKSQKKMLQDKFQAKNSSLKLCTFLINIFYKSYILIIYKAMTLFLAKFIEETNRGTFHVFLFIFSNSTKKKIFEKSRSATCMHLRAIFLHIGVHLCTQAGNWCFFLGNFFPKIPVT